jgi:hypothetical protein
MKAMGNIYLTWRSGKGESRHKVGVLRRNSTEGVRFNYIISQEEATQIGFIPYTDFPDLTKVYTENVLEIFGHKDYKIRKE